jgi:hypothetical protein
MSIHYVLLLLGIFVAACIAGYLLARYTVLGAIARARLEARMLRKRRQG